MKSLLGGEWVVGGRPNLMLAQVQNLWSLVLGHDMGPDLDLTWDLDPDLSLTIISHLDM